MFYPRKSPLATCASRGIAGCTRTQGRANGIPGSLRRMRWLPLPILQTIHLALRVMVRVPSNGLKGTTSFEVIHENPKSGLGSSIYMAKILGMSRVVSVAHQLVDPAMLGLVLAKLTFIRSAYI